MRIVQTTPFTRADYEKLPEGFPAQLIQGMLVREPARSYLHQEIVKRVFQELARSTDPGRVYSAPADVVLDDLNVVQPDLQVIREVLPLAPDARPQAAPALVVEVLSPATAERDRDVKARLYLEGGVEEVWLVDPDRRAIEVRARSGSRVARGERRIASRILPGFGLVPDRLFS